MKIRTWTAGTIVLLGVFGLLACGDETSDGSEDPSPIEKCLDLCDHVFLEQYCGLSAREKGRSGAMPINMKIAGTRYTETSCGVGCASGEIPQEAVDCFFSVSGGEVCSESRWAACSIFRVR